MYISRNWIWTYIYKHGAQTLAPEDHIWFASLDPKKDNFETLEKVAFTLCDNGILLNMEKFYSYIWSIKTHRR